VSGVIAEWKGTDQEGGELVHAWEANHPEEPLSSCQTVFADQRVLDHLLFVRRMVVKFVVAEFTEVLES
jgi:hypothetical protein